MIRPVVFCIVILSLWEESHCWDNLYDEELNKECPPGQHFYKIKSEHDNGREDRLWEWTCRDGFVSTDCTWTDDYVNNWDDPLDYTCPDNNIIAGVNSYHDNGKEDRIWKYKCCKLNTKAGIYCETTGYINDWDEYMDYQVPVGKAIVGFESWHDNGREDRRWKVKLCNFAICQAKNMIILDDIQPTKVGYRVVGIASSQGCSSAAEYTNHLGSTNSVTETYGFTTSEGGSYTWGTTLTVESTASVGFLVGGSITVGQSGSTGGSNEWSSSETVETSTGQESSSSTTMTYTGPGASLIMADVQEYEFDTSNVNVEYEIHCDDGTQFKEQGTTTLTADTFGQTHYTHRHGIFNEGHCNSTTNTCIRNVNGALALTPDAVIAQFDACFANGVGSVWSSVDGHFIEMHDRNSDKNKKEKSTDCDSALIPLLCVHG